MKRTVFLGAAAAAAALPLAAAAPGIPPRPFPTPPVQPAPSPPVPPTPELLAAFRAAALPVALKDGALSGPGAARLRAGLRGVQFVGVGEEHNNADADAFTQALYALLAGSHGFRHAALETDALFGRMVSAPGVVGDAAAVRALARRYPMAPTFSGDEELALIAALGRLSDAPTDRIWGIDQFFGVRHVLDRLLPFAPSDAARAATAQILAAAAPYETTRFGREMQLLESGPLPPAFDRLRELYRPAPGSEAAWLIDQLLLSRSIYERAQHEDGRLSASRDREQNMTSLFTAKYRAATAAGEAPPKVLVKAGRAHASRQSEIPGVTSLGASLAELAARSGGRYLNVALLLRSYEKVDASIAYLAPLQAAASADGWTYVDLAQVLRSGSAAAGRIDPRLRALLDGFDAALVFPKAHPVARTVVPD